MTDFPPLTHVALTVRDLSVSVPWYEALLDAEPVIDEDTDPDMHHTVYLLGNGTLLGLHQHGTAAPAEQFSEFRVGLDHVAFGCADRAELEKWAAAPRRARHRARPHQGRGLRLGRELPRPRRHRARVLRPALVSDGATPAPTRSRRRGGRRVRRVANHPRRRSDDWSPRCSPCDPTANAATRTCHPTRAARLELRVHVLPALRRRARERVPELRWRLRAAPGPARHPWRPTTGLVNDPPDTERRRSRTGRGRRRADRHPPVGRAGQRADVVARRPRRARRNRPRWRPPATDITLRWVRPTASVPSCAGTDLAVAGGRSTTHDVDTRCGGAARPGRGRRRRDPRRRPRHRRRARRGGRHRDLHRSHDAHDPLGVRPAGDDRGDRRPGHVARWPRHRRRRRPPRPRAGARPSPTACVPSTATSTCWSTTSGAVSCSRADPRSGARRSGSTTSTTVCGSCAWRSRRTS